MAYSDFINNAYQSKNLVYRALEDNSEDRTWIAECLLNDPAITIMGSQRLAHPAPQTSVQDYIDNNKRNLLNVVICLPSDEKESTPTKNSSKAPIPIGIISLFGYGQHHRNAIMGLNITQEYRGKGYGGEAINWALDWGFRRAGLHRITIKAFSYNASALHLYLKVGFIEEGREREAVLYDRKWHDGVVLGMLEHEWEEIRAKELV